MGLFSSTPIEEKVQKNAAKALDDMGITVETVKQKDGLVHVGCFRSEAGMSSYKLLSLTIDGVLKFLQENGREVIDVKVSPCGAGDSILSQLVTVLYR